MGCSPLRPGERSFCENISLDSDGKEVIVVLNLQLYSICESVCGVSNVSTVCVCVRTVCVCFQLPGNGHSFPLMYPVQYLLITSRFQCRSRC